MKRRWLFIVTRLTATKGAADDDEFVMTDFWNQPEELSSSRYAADECQLVVFHGYQGALPEDPEERVRALIALLEQEMPSSENDPIIGVLIHDDLERWGGFGELLKRYGQMLQAGLDPEALGSGQPGYDLYKNLSKKVVSDDQEGFCVTFDEIWKRFARDSTVESKLKLLTLCLTPAGATKLANETSNPSFSAEEWNAVTSAAEDLKTKNAFDKDYMDTLAELRNKLLDG